MRPAEKPTQRQCDGNGRVRFVLDGVANDIFEGGRRLSYARRRAAGGIFGLPVQILGGALSLVDDALDLAFCVARDTTKTLLDPAARVPGRASYSMFVHCILLYGSEFPSDLFKR
jgi:hypothetical protein